jgi:DNA primase
MTEHRPRSVDQATRQYDVIRFLMQQGLDPQPSGDDDVMVCCPFCSDHKPRLGVNTGPRNGLWNCFNCGRSGDLVALLTAPEVGGMTYAKACQTILRQSTLRRSTNRVSSPERQTILDDSATSPAVSLPAEFHPLLNMLRQMPPEERVCAPFRQYLSARGLSPALVEEYGIGWCRTGRYRWRVITPVMLRGTLVAFEARTIDDRRWPKVLTGGRKGEALFNLDRLWGREDVVLVEGIFDALALPDQAVAVLGSRLSAAQIRLLVESGARRLTFCFDPDVSGLKAVANLAEQLVARFDDIRVAHLPAGTDPANVGPARLQEALLNAVPYTSGERIRLRHLARIG